jgi:hypothetical protein
LQNWFQKKNKLKTFALKMKCLTPYVLLTFEEGTSILSEDFTEVLGRFGHLDRISATSQLNGFHVAHHWPNVNIHLLSHGIQFTMQGCQHALKSCRQLLQLQSPVCFELQVMAGQSPNSKY